jgi:hypothetical protein
LFEVKRRPQPIGEVQSQKDKGVGDQLITRCRSRLIGAPPLLSAIRDHSCVSSASDRDIYARSSSPPLLAPAACPADGSGTSAVAA